MDKQDKNISGITDDLRSVFEASRPGYTENPYLLSTLRSRLSEEHCSELEELAKRYWVFSLCSGVTASAVTACCLPLLVSAMSTATVSMSCDPLFMSMVGW